MDGAEPIAAAPAMPFDVLRGRIHLVGLFDRDLRQHERNDEFTHLQFRNPQIARLFFGVPELFDKSVSGAVRRQIYEGGNPRVISEAPKHGTVDPGRQR
jgi:hypothetical protein